MKLTKILHTSIIDSTSIPSPVSLPLPNRVVLPLASPWGEAEPLVKVGEEVRTGQCIAKSDDPRVPPVNATVNGTVAGIRSWPGHGGREVPAVIIHSNGMEEEPAEPSGGNGADMDAQTILRRISEAGIREADLHPWPLALRIAPQRLVFDLMESPAYALTRPIETLIINGIDREPGIFARRALLNERYKDLWEAIAILQRVTSAEKTVFAVPARMTFPDDFQEGGSGLEVQVLQCPHKYPLALTPLLTQYVVKREVPQPSNDARLVGAVVVDVATALNVLDVVRDSAGAYETLCHVETPSMNQSAFVRARIGTLMEDIFRSVPLLPRKPAKVIVGGLFLGHAQYTLQLPVTQETDSLILQVQQEIGYSGHDACINCGACVQHCPMRLLPNELGKYCEYGKFEDAESKNLFHCIECGICSYVCPAKRPMVHLLRHGKKEIQGMREAS